MDDLTAFLNARYDELEAIARRNIGATPGTQHGLGDTEDGGPMWPDYQTYDSDDLTAASEYLTAFRPLRMLADIALKRAILAVHVPIESMYGPACVMCVRWQDAPVIEGGETEFGIAIPEDWPCATVRQLGTEFAGHPGYRAEWGPQA